MCILNPYKYECKWELDHKESWVLKNWCFWTVVLEKTLESPLACKEIRLVHPKGDESWVFIGRADVEVETPILWPPDGKSWLIWKDPDAGKDWGQEGKGATEDEMVGWHHRLDGHEFEQAPGVGDGRGGLACLGSRGRKELDTTERVNWTELNIQRKQPEYKTGHHTTTSGTLCGTPHLNNKENKNTNQVISRNDYHLTQPCPSEEKETNKQKLSTNLALYKAYRNQWSALRGQKPKVRKNSTFKHEKRRPQTQ